MDPFAPATLAGKATAEITTTAKQEAEGFFRAVYAEPAKSLGALMALPLNKRLYRNAVKAVVEANQILKDAGISPQQVPLSIIHPALQAASLEEHPEIQTLWAHLIANAADPQQRNPVMPAFTSILKELRPVDAKLIEGLYKNSRAIIDTQPTAFSRTLQDIQYQTADLLEMYVRAGLARITQLSNMTARFYRENKQIIDDDARDCLLSFSLATRLGILTELSRIPPQRLDEAVQKGSTMLSLNMQTVLFFSPFGEAFMRACLESPSA
jgi:hypothetical protein